MVAKKRYVSFIGKKVRLVAGFYAGRESGEIFIEGADKAYIVFGKILFVISGILFKAGNTFPAFLFSLEMSV